MNILVVEDDAVLADGISTALQDNHYTVECVSNGEDADHLLTVSEYRLVVLDLTLPKLDGIEVLRRLRSRKVTTPVLILTARQALSHRVEGLDAGADDYLSKPFALEEFEARVRALLRRTYFAQENELAWGPLTYHLQSHHVTLDNHPLQLSARELAVLKVLLSHRGQVVQKRRILDDLVNIDSELSENAVEVYMSRLRKKIRHPRLAIRSVRRLGYTLELVSHVAS